MTEGRSRCMVEARVLRRWLFFFLVEYLEICVKAWIKPYIKAKKLGQMTRESGGKEHKLFHLSCLHCGYPRRAVLKKI